MTTAHSKIGASTCERWWNCPGSVALIETVPPQPQGPYAAEGTAAHELAEKCLREGLDADKCVGQFSKNGYEWTEEMAEAVQVYLDTIREDMVKYNLTEEDLQIEHKFHLVDVDANAFGTNDANLQVFLTRVIVYDYKHGQGTVVEAEDNRQGLYYALGASLNGDYDEIEIVIVQPRAVHRDGPVRRWVITKEQLDEFRDELKSRIAATRQPDAKLRPGPWCKKTFCAAAAVCPAIKKQVELVAGDVFNTSKIEEIKLPEPARMSPLELRRLLDLAPLIDSWLAAVQNHALSLAMRGEKVVDYKLVRKKSNRKWIDEANVCATLEAKYGDMVYNAPKLKSPAQMEKALGKAGKEEVAALTTKPLGGLVLVPYTDPREEVTPNPAEVFEAFDQSNLIE